MTIKSLFRFTVIGAISLILWIGLAFVLNNVSERSERRDQVYAEMSQNSAGPQTIAGPFLVLGKDQIIVPKKLKIEGKFETEKRYRSLFEVLMYQSKLKMAGEFEIPKDWILQAGPLTSPYLVFFIQDSRGIATIPAVQWNGSMLEVKPGRRDINAGFQDGFHSALPALTAGENADFSIDLDLKGMQSFSWVPAGMETDVRIEADWPHPSFSGRSLPIKPLITKSGFTAQWRATEFSQDIKQYLTANPYEAIKDMKTQGIGFKLIDPIDIYRLSERSVKYGFLLIIVTFAAFLGFEYLKQLSIHPIQYAFVGLALLLFYVLLLALSEHVSFAKAYLTASIASVSLLAFYVSFVLHSWTRSLGFASALLLLKATIYGILLSEDYALLYGAILLFTLLAGAMTMTRKVDWNAPTTGSN